MSLMSGSVICASHPFQYLVKLALESLFQSVIYNEQLKLRVTVYLMFSDRFEYTVLL